MSKQWTRTTLDESLALFAKDVKNLDEPTSHRTTRSFERHKTLDASTLNCVREELQSAKENGYDFALWTNLDIAGDIIAYCDTFDKWKPAALAEYVEEVRKTFSWQ